MNLCPARVRRAPRWWSLWIVALLALGVLSGLEATLDAPVVHAQQATVDINSADLKALMSLPGVGKVTAERIIAYRTEKGPFKSVKDLRNVKGIGEKTLAKFESMVTVGPGGAAQGAAVGSRDAEDAELDERPARARQGGSGDDDDLIDLTASPGKGKGKGKGKDKGKEAAGSKGEAAAAPGGLININTATEAELTTLDGIGPSKAKAIIAHRQTVGPFKTVDDLALVKGIGKGTVAKLRDRITVQ